MCNIGLNKLKNITGPRPSIRREEGVIANESKIILNPKLDLKTWAGNNGGRFDAILITSPILSWVSLNFH